MLASKMFVNLLSCFLVMFFQQALELFHETRGKVPSFLLACRRLLCGLPESGWSEKPSVNSALLFLRVAQRLHFLELNQIMLCENSHLGPKVIG